MPKFSHSRRHHYNSLRQQQSEPIFCSKQDVDVPNLINEYLHNTHEPAKPIVIRNPHSRNNNITNELNANLEQILRSYLAQFWRHGIEKERGSCGLWDEITGSTPRPRPPPQYAALLRSRLPSPTHAEPQWWWRQDPFILDDGPLVTSSSELTPYSSASTPSSTSSVSSTSTSSSAPATPIYGTPDTSPNTSPPSAVTSLNLTQGDAGAPARSEKTRWQLYAERLFAHLLRIPHFSLNLHMQALIRVYHHGNLRKDVQLVDIVRNYLATVL